jgi:histone H2A
MPTKVANTKRHRARKYTFSTYIYKVLKQVHPELGASSKGMLVLNGMCQSLIAKLMSVANELCQKNKKQTITTREIQTAVRMCLPGELAKHGVSEATKAVTKWTPKEQKAPKGQKAPRAQAKSNSAKAGLVFPVGRIFRQMKALSTTKRISMTAAVYIAAVVEYIVAEILELAGNAARDNKKTRFNPRFVVLAIRNDEELDKLFQHDTIAYGGVRPNIHRVLLPKKQQLKLQSQAASTKK